MNEGLALDNYHVARCIGGWAVIPNRWRGLAGFAGWHSPEIDQIDEPMFVGPTHNTFLTKEIAYAVMHWKNIWETAKWQTSIDLDRLRSGTSSHEPPASVPGTSVKMAGWPRKMPRLSTMASKLRPVLRTFATIARRSRQA